MLDKDQRFMGGQQWRLFLLLGTMLFLSACASNVVVKTDFPVPLVRSLPLNGELTFTDEFKRYTYFENAKARRSLKSLDMAEAQVSLFKSVFNGLINLVGPETSNKHLNIVPEVLDFQYTSPSETQLKHYEVWIKYRLKINNGLNQKIADWTVKGYGKTPTSLLTSPGGAFSAAATIALRDVGAQIAIQFPRQQVIQSLLAGESPDVIDELPSNDSEVQKTENSEPSETSPKNDKAEANNAS